jgi:toxin ParE1/3/4
VARFRLSRSAQEDIARILATSAERWGADARRRYAALLAAAMKKMAADPVGSATRSRAELLTGMRSFHLRYAGGGGPEPKVKRPAHILYYRPIEPGLIEIVRVLHERMEPSRHLDARSED